MKDSGLYLTGTPKNSANRYEGLEAMRVISSFAVVFFHVCGAVDVPENLNGLVKFRDFALPAMVVSSFFVMTVSLDRKMPETFRHFFNICATPIAYSLSFLCAVLIRKIFPFDRLMPLIKTCGGKYSGDRVLRRLRSNTDEK